jgi:lipopolysaccharide export system protein LptC
VNAPSATTPELGDANGHGRPARSNRTWIMAALLLGVAGAALLVLERRSVPPMAVEPTAVPGEPDFSMEGAVVHQYRDDGTLEYQLSAQAIRHFEERAETRLRTPQLTLHHPDQAPWQVRARTGVLRRPPAGASEETVSLRRDVVLEQTRADGEYVKLTTRALDVYPRRQYARTSHDVIIDSLVGRTTAYGLFGDLQLGLLTFH